MKNTIGYIFAILLIFITATSGTYYIGYQRGIERATYNCNEVNAALLWDLKDCRRTEAVQKHRKN